MVRDDHQDVNKVVLPPSWCWCWHVNDGHSFFELSHRTTSQRYHASVMAAPRLTKQWNGGEQEHVYLLEAEFWHWGSLTFNGGFFLFFRIRFEVLIFMYFLVEAIYSVYSCYFFIVKSVTFLVFFHNFGNIYRRMAFTFCTLVFFNKSFFEREREREKNIQIVPI